MGGSKNGPAREGAEVDSNNAFHSGPPRPCWFVQGQPVKEILRWHETQRHEVSGGLAIELCSNWEALFKWMDH